LKILATDKGAQQFALPFQSVVKKSIRFIVQFLTYNCFTDLLPLSIFDKIPY